MSTVDIAMVSALIALASAAAAWGALFAHRRNTIDSIRAQINIAARSSRAAVVSANRQQWINALRDDIADFVATRSHLAGLNQTGSFQQPGVDALHVEERQFRTKLLMLRTRIELRINRNESEHLALLHALDRYNQEASIEADTELRKLASGIFKAEWERLKKEASGIDPFVRPATFRDA